jgi:hypothetical protein
VLVVRVGRGARGRIFGETGQHFLCRRGIVFFFLLFLFLDGSGALGGFDGG